MQKQVPSGESVDTHLGVKINLGSGDNFVVPEPWVNF